MLARRVSKPSKAPGPTIRRGRAARLAAAAGIAVLMFGGLGQAGAQSSPPPPKSSPAPKPNVTAPQGARQASSAPSQDGRSRVPAPTSPAQRAALPPADDEQKAAAELVYYGKYVCDQKWEIHVERHRLSPGYVDVRYQKDVWVMKPVASATGAVRLEDMKQHTLLVQIPSKSMLLNTRTGQRVVDSCVGEGHANAMKEPVGTPSEPTAVAIAQPSALIATPSDASPASPSTTLPGSTSSHPAPASGAR